MHFNASRTIYFRQARTINELAKKVFNLLKVNPDNFEREFSETIQRDGRMRNQKDFKDSRNVKLSESSVSMSSKYIAGSSNATPYRENFKSNHGRSDIAKHVDARVLENPMGSRNSGRYKSFEVDRRCTYRPYMSPSESESIFQTIYGQLKLLEQVNQEDIGYIESLMLFVKDLGQEVKNTVRRKLFGYEIYTGSATAPLKLNTINTCVNSINLEIAGGNKVVYINDGIDHDQVEMALNAGQGKAHSPLKDNIQASQSMPIECDKSYWSDLDHSRAYVAKLDCLADGSKGIGGESETMLLGQSKSDIKEQMSKSSIIEHSHTASKLRFKNKWEFQTSSFKQDKIQTQNLRMQHIRSDQEYVACSFEAGKILQSNQTMPLASGFVFNLPYLKTRLDQINPSEHNSKGGKKPCSVQACYTEH
ncbi:uncharacterized protein LOC114722545 [Neltuma alba]|uniref:uncharacterized protein LOC114722545 n=1 Tax=Neltuma alba TaxID=207710 RepID=UPI0010A3F5EE|nr:uncharacterized protein LOC114722545 [Prosopis alba]